MARGAVGAGRPVQRAEIKDRSSLGGALPTGLSVHNLAHVNSRRGPTQHIRRFRSPPTRAEPRALHGDVPPPAPGRWPARSRAELRLRLGRCATHNLTGAGRRGGSSSIRGLDVGVGGAGARSSPDSTGLALDDGRSRPDRGWRPGDQPKFKDRRLGGEPVASPRSIVRGPSAHPRPAPTPERRPKSFRHAESGLPGASSAPGRPAYLAR